MAMRVIFATRGKHHCTFAEQVSLEDALTSADLVSIDCSLNAETSNLIAAPDRQNLPPQSMLINTARGRIVDEADRVHEIQHKLIGGISFDVLVEKLTTDSLPRLSITELENVIMTAHSASVREQAMQRLTNILADNVDTFLLGSAHNLAS